MFVLVHHTPDGQHVELGRYDRFMSGVYEIESLADVHDEHGADLKVDHDRQIAILKVSTGWYPDFLTSYWTLRQI